MAGVYDWLYGYGLKSQAQLLSEDPRGSALEAQIVESGQIRLGKPFWQDPAPYIRNSPIFEVERIDSPLLILQGDLDLGVSGLGAAQRMYYALVRAGKKPALVRCWGEGHVCPIGVGSSRSVVADHEMVRRVPAPAIEFDFTAR